MKPYVESGRSAQESLSSLPVADPAEQRLVSSLRGFKQVINLLGVFGIVLTPVIGLIMRSALISAIVALNFLAVIVVLELLERRVKHALHVHREGATNTGPAAKA